MGHDMNKPVQVYVTANVWRLPNIKVTGKRMGLGYQTSGNACAPASPTSRAAFTDRERRPKRIPCTYFCKKCDAEDTSKRAPWPNPPIVF